MSQRAASWAENDLASSPKPDVLGIGQWRRRRRDDRRSLRIGQGSKRLRKGGGRVSLLEDIFDNFFQPERRLFSLSPSAWNPPVDVSETPERIYIRMEIAGVRREDLSVTVERGVLIIRGKRYNRAPAEQEEFHIMEIGYGNFERVFRLPPGIDESHICATYRDGFLDIEIAKTPASSRSITVTVRDG